MTLAGKKVLKDINLEIHSGTTVALTGPSGSGKTVLAKAMTGEIFHSGSIDFLDLPLPVTVAYVQQEHSFRTLSNTADFYYQQRFNASESEHSLKVSDLISADNKWIDPLRLKNLFDRPVLQLSNGENKRLQLAQHLAGAPSIVILDNPFIGLDVSGRSILEEILSKLISEGVHIIIVTSPSTIPAFVTHVVALSDGEVSFSGSRSQFLLHVDTKGLESNHPPAHNHDARLDALIITASNLPLGIEFKNAVQMNDVSIKYGSMIVLHKLNWIVRRGECWSVSGPNGAGKSTLLSLITADNPQAYANEIYLFDRRRGTGESIWDIKRNIGFVSPELHLYFDPGSTCFEIIASGLFDTIGLFRNLSSAQRAIVSGWIDVMGLAGSAERAMRSMSRGQQRLALLARALVKNPPLLILDEPCQGLDDEQTSMFISLVDNICSSADKTLIYVSHYLQDIPACVNNFLRLENGKVIS